MLFDFLFFLLIKHIILLTCTITNMYRKLFIIYRAIGVGIRYKMEILKNVRKIGRCKCRNINNIGY